jgi:enoyl-CoA hydratase/carnithine racemase
VQVEYRSDRIAVITLDRPHVINALDRATVARLRAIVREVDADPRVDVLLLTARGERGFCVGADLKERQGLSAAQTRTLVVDEMLPMFREFDRRAKPAVAAVFGHVMGGGFELALCCDLIVAAQDTVFALPEVKWAKIPAAAGCRKLPGIIGPMRAKAMILAGERLSAGEAQTLGLTHRVVPRAELLEQALAVAQRIAAGSPVAVQAARRCIDDAMEMPAAAAFDVAASQECYEREDQALRLAGFGGK